MYPFPGNERLAKLRAYMEKNGIDLCLFSSPENIAYFSGFQAITYTRPIRLIVTAEESCLIIPALEEEHASAITTIDRIQVYYEHPPRVDYNPSFLSLLQAHLCNNGKSLVGIEFGALSYGQAEMIKNWGGKVTDLSQYLIKSRAIKDEYEKACIREAGRLCCYAMGISLAEARPGVSELEFEQYGTAALYKLISNSDYPYTFSSPACFTPSGAERTNMPHVFSGLRKFQNQDMVIHVRKPAINGYHGELERTFCIGKPTDKVKRAFSAMVEAQIAIFDVIRPGVRSKDMDALARAVLKKYGYEEFAIHRCGHGQGLGRHEEPFLIFDSDLVLEENMVLTVEPGIYIPGVGGFRHSDTIILHKGGYENTTDFKRLPDELIFS